MKREDFEHVLRAAAGIVNDELVVVGSQVVLVDHPEAPPELLMSMEVDLYPRGQPERADEIDANLGDGSLFHETFGYYAHGVGPETVIGPAGWEGRLRPLELVGHKGERVVARCLEMHDLVLAKLAAGREHDYEFVEGALRANLVDRDQVRLGVDWMPEPHRQRVRERLEGLLSKVERSEANLNGDAAAE
jgi:uncharacterized nucleotidyltransferase DUF6036